jgi:hypothetical protein
MSVPTLPATRCWIASSAWQLPQGAPGAVHSAAVVVSMLER